MDSIKRIREDSNLKLRIRVRSGPRIRANSGRIRIRANSCEFEPASLKSPAPHYIMVGDSPAPQCIVVEEFLVPMSGVKDRPCLVVESPEPTEDPACTTSPVPMSK